MQHQQNYYTKRVLYSIHVLNVFIIIFGCAGSSLLREDFSSCGERASHCSGLSCWGLEALERGLSSSGAPAYLACSRWDLPGPGREPVSPALAGGFLTTGPPGKSLRRFLTDLIVDSFLFFLNKTGHLYAVQPVEYN